MFGKIAIRNIPAEIWNGLELLAQQHDRSTEAEARFALRSWVEPLTRRNERSARRTEVSARLREMLDQVNKVLWGQKIKPSHIAKAIGEDYAETVENWFAGEIEPSFSQLDAMALFLGGRSEWLQHADGSIFPVESIRVPEDPTAAVTWLLNLENSDNRKVDSLHLIREAGHTGAFAVIKQYDDWRCNTYSTPYHISEEIGAGGENSLARLSVILHLLYKYYTRSGTHLSAIKSYIMPKEDYANLLSGQVHPLSVLRQSEDAPWWEDFWDVNEFRGESAGYWIGWKSVCERIHRVVENSPSLRNQQELIATNQHPMLRQKFEAI